MFLIIPFNLSVSQSGLDSWVNSPYYNPMAFVQALGGFATAIAVYYAFRQVKTAKIQQFESTFFKLVDLHYNIINNFNYDALKGNQLFDRAKKDLSDAISSQINLEPTDYDDLQQIVKSPITDIEHAKTIYNNQYYKYYYIHFEKELNHYFRNLFHILKYVDKTNLISIKQKRFYSSILRAQLSQNQLYIWLFNSMQIGYGYPDALYLINKYDMMQNFRFKELEPQFYWELFSAMKDIKPSSNY